MEHCQKDHIRRNLMKLINGTSNLPVLLASLYSREIISKSTKQIIESYPDECSKGYELYTSLMKTCKYNQIIESLIETENPKAAAILQEVGGEFVNKIVTIDKGDFDKRRLNIDQAPLPTPALNAAKLEE